MPVLGRISSNKDQGTVYSLSPTTRKPRLAGVGKAPKHSGARHISGKHSGDAVFRAFRKASIRKDRHVPGPLTADVIPTSAPAPEAALPSHSSMQVKGFVITNNIGMTLRIPACLPKPAIAPNPAMAMSDGTVVPTPFVQERLTPLLERIYNFGQYFQSFPHVPSPPSPDQALEGGLRKSFAWGVPFIVNGHDSEGRLAATLRPFQPDVCLAVRKRDGGKDAPFHITAISYTVYAAFFSYFPRRFNITPSDLVTQVITSENRSPLSTVWETPHPDDMEDMHEADTDDNDDDQSSCSGASALATFENGEYAHLPILAMDVPDPSTMSLIHDRLHHPFSKWQPALLDLPPFPCMTPETAESHLAERSILELAKVLTRIQGVWKNLAALGLENDAMWRELGSAYSIVMAVFAKRAGQQPSATL
ncbi:hypothetical protein CC85DRAFT_328558 [Cutaneotrichosporon oleaginosum]|uniref:Uncharacterized protein n=1 Tax=Cutaneotrichosporon oleaginosum TaxID=879819 RepID=A0A0J0XLQ0_9TREE|nr:uncharacterized protein CC85DRAFT_328558 [Cutaneotrichosporon oleaginosum]KLT41993.1 hypothetical protein CC85DRAFT_328558 [Cutaneotrichosporon oleaginosum]TXT14348.1 hypothetical protein COLE_00541 [Cutaneotrichosporon oleaginosum]